MIILHHFSLAGKPTNKLLFMFADLKTVKLARTDYNKDISEYTSLRRAAHEVIGINNDIKKCFIPTRVPIQSLSRVEFEEINLKQALSIHRSLIENEFIDNVSLNTLEILKEKEYQKHFGFLINLSKALDEEIAYILLRWDGIYYDEEKTEHI